MTTTVAQAHRLLVAEMDEAGDAPEEIAKKLGISVDRVEAILDQLDESDGRPAHPDDEHRAPAVEPVLSEPRPVEQSGPIVVGSPARAPRKKPSVEVRPVPDMPAEAEDIPAADLVMTDQQRAEIEALRAELAAPPRCGDKQGTYAGYQWHASHDDLPPCDPCRDARRAYDRDHAASSPTTAAAPKSRRRPREHGTVRGAQQHWSYKEEVCDDCREAYNAAKRKSVVDWPKPAPRKPKAAKPAAVVEVPAPEPVREVSESPATNDVGQSLLLRPAATVAHLVLPLTVASLTAITDALELAYGPDLRVVEAPGGVWVLGAAS